MKNFLRILSILLVAIVAACRPLPKEKAAEEAVAVVGMRQLNIEELRAALPQGLKGDDSVSYADAYVAKWLVQQLKLNEAENIFVASADDVEHMVEEYRRSLLIRKLEQHYIDTEVADSISSGDIASYYKVHKGDFRLTTPMVKGMIVKMPEKYRGHEKMVKKMTSKSAEQRRELKQMCEKNNFTYTKFDEWVDFSEFLSHLPLTRKSTNTSLLSKRKVQQIYYNRSVYCFVISDALREGEVMPMYMAEDDIRRILINRRRMDIIRRHEERLLQEALSSGRAKVHD